MPILLLIRHAVTDSVGKRLTGRAPGIDLSPQGREQAGRLAKALSGIPLAGLYASPLERCIQTAEFIAAGRGVAVTPLPEVLEVDFGRWTGRPLAQLARTRLWREVQRSPGTVRFPGGESMTEAQRRAVDAINAIAARHRRGIVGVVSHGDVIRLALAHFAGVHIDLFQRLIVSPGSVSAVALERSEPRILAINHTIGLGDLLGQGRGGQRRPGGRKAGP
jgi:probable phosphomutase (TIGR03848 family)